MRTDEKLARVEETSEIGILYCDMVSDNTVSELEAIREVLHSKNIEMVKISQNRPLCKSQPQQDNREKGEINEQTEE